MSDAVEIYVCMPGQSLKEGKVEYSQTIYDKFAAEQDAQKRVKINPKIHKIAYYKINAEGDFRIFYSFTNPDATNQPRTVIQQHDKKPKKKKPRKRSFLERLFGVGGGKKTTLKKKPVKTAKKK